MIEPTLTLSGRGPLLRFDHTSSFCNRNPLTIKGLTLVLIFAHLAHAGTLPLTLSESTVLRYTSLRYQLPHLYTARSASYSRQVKHESATLSYNSGIGTLPAVKRGSDSILETRISSSKLLQNQKDSDYYH